MRQVGRTVVAGVALLASGFLAAACAPIYLPGGRLPTVEPLRLERAGRPTATLRLSGSQFLEPIERASRESGLFRTLAIEPEGTRTPSTDYTVTLEVKTARHRPTGGQVAYTLSAALTLGILPMINQIDLTLTATLADRSGQVLRSYTFEDSIREVQQVAIMFIPIGEVLNVDRAAARILENMMRHLYRQIEADRLLYPESTSSNGAHLREGRHARLRT
jgi:hypothetical protein